MRLLDFLTVLVSCITIFLVIVSFFVVKFKVVEYEETIQKKDKEITDLTETIKKLKERKPRKKKETKKREKPAKKGSVKSR
ncbi:MAG: hypothetical protein J5982_03450 [Bacilli bacterium]|nr:hypothetical protein [Bacilli bacterium]